MSQSVDESVSQWMSQSGQSVSQWMSQSVGESVSESQSVDESGLMLRLAMNGHVVF